MHSFVQSYKLENMQTHHKQPRHLRAPTAVGACLEDLLLLLLRYCVHIVCATLTTRMLLQTERLSAALALKSKYNSRSDAMMTVVPWSKSLEDTYICCRSAGGEIAYTKVARAVYFCRVSESTLPV